MKKQNDIQKRKLKPDPFLKLKEKYGFFIVNSIPFKLYENVIVEPEKIFSKLKKYNLPIIVEEVFETQTGGVFFKVLDFTTKKDRKKILKKYIPVYTKNIRSPIDRVFYYLRSLDDIGEYVPFHETPYYCGENRETDMKLNVKDIFSSVKSVKRISDTTAELLVNLIDRFSFEIVNESVFVNLNIIRYYEDFQYNPPDKKIKIVVPVRFTFDDIEISTFEVRVTLSDFFEISRGNYVFLNINVPWFITNISNNNLKDLLSEKLIKTISNYLENSTFDDLCRISKNQNVKVIYCPVCERFIPFESEYLEKVFTDYFDFTSASLVTHYRHNHVKYYDRSFNPRYKKYIPCWNYETFKREVNNRAKRQIIRKLSKSKIEPQLINKFLDGFSILMENDEKTIELIEKTRNKFQLFIEKT